MPSNRRSQRYQNGGPPGDMSGQISHIQWRENRDSDQSTQEARLQHSSSEDNQQSDSAETQNDTCTRRLCGRCNPGWLATISHNTFRYGLILVYLGTLFIVIGFHNAWVAFVRYIGFVMVCVGLASLTSAVLQSCQGYSRSNRVRKDMMF